MAFRHAANLTANHRRHFPANGTTSDLAESLASSTVSEYLKQTVKMADLLLTSDGSSTPSPSSPVAMAFAAELDVSPLSPYQTTTEPATNSANSTLLSLISQSPYFPTTLVEPTESDLLDNEIERDELVQQYFHNRALDSISLLWLGVIYTVLIFIGALGNGLVCLAVARQPKMRTSRNLFIINLAISDLLLCFFTIPFSLVEISTKSWPYGVAMCKLVSALEATSIFVSTLSITAIALDRYQAILYSMNQPGECRQGAMPQVAKLLLIWAIGIMLALPLFLYRTVEAHKIGIPEIDPIKYCIEKWPLQHGRFYYSVFSMLIQYFVPIIIVTVVYTRLCLKLRSRTLRRTSTTQLPKLRTRMQRRTRRTNMLLIAIALIFCISWLPLNALNVISDLYYPFPDDRSFRITFAICHMAGMSSSCSNPFLYGWLNQNFRSEFEQIFDALKRTFLRVCLKKETPNGTHANRNGHSTMLSPNHELNNYTVKNTECTVTDIRNGRTNKSVVINVEGKSHKNGSVKHIMEKRKKKKGCFLAEPSTMETRTTQIHMSTPYERTEETTCCSDANNAHFQANGRSDRSSAVCRFKRLSLTDSRKRNRKKTENRDQHQHLSHLAMATEQIAVTMDNNNNNEGSNPSNGKPNHKSLVVVEVEEKSHNLVETLLSPGKERS